MRAIVTAIVFFKQRTVCIINVWGCAEILPRNLLCIYTISGTSNISNTNSVLNVIHRALGKEQ